MGVVVITTVTGTSWQGERDRAGIGVGIHPGQPGPIHRFALSHLRISASALLVAVLLYVPLGIVSTRLNRGSVHRAVGALSSLRVIPSLALVFIFVPWLGFGYRPALLAPILLAAPPIVLNTFAGMRSVDASVIEAAQGLGMNRAQVFTRVQFPLAFPVILAGIRSASVEIVASATLASLIGVKTLGQFIFTGISLLDTTYLLAGGLPIVVLVLTIESVLRWT